MEFAEDNRGLTSPIVRDEFIEIMEKVAHMKSLEVELIASEARYRELFENLRDGVFYSDSYGNIISINSAGAEILGYRSSDELLEGAAKVWMVFAGDEFDALRNMAYNWGNAVCDILRFRRLDGNLGWLEMTLRSRRDNTGEVIGLIGAFKDVSNQIRSQEMFEAIIGLWADLAEVDSLEKVGEITLDFLKTMLGIDRGRLSVVEGELIKPREFHYSSIDPYDLGLNLSSKAVKTGVTQRYPDYHESILGRSNWQEGEYHLTQLAVPIKMDGGVVGVIHLCYTDGALFTDEDVKLVETVSDQVAIALNKLVRSKIGPRSDLSLADFL